MTTRYCWYRTHIPLYMYMCLQRTIELIWAIPACVSSGCSLEEWSPTIFPGSRRCGKSVQPHKRKGNSRSAALSVPTTVWACENVFQLTVPKQGLSNFRNETCVHCQILLRLFFDFQGSQGSLTRTAKSFR